MLKAAPASASLVVCSTCRFSAEEREDAQGRRGGVLFAQALADALTGHAVKDRIVLQQMPCLFACSNHCTVFLRGEGKLGYILGKFAPCSEDALALLDYVAHYLDSPDGVVPYGRWPDGVKGHFLVRVPPEGAIWDPPVAISNAEIILTRKSGD